MGRLRLILFGILTAAFIRAETHGESDRLMATARLWTAVEYFHPYLAGGDIDWDVALVKALPLVRSATSDDEFEKAISALLGVLHDPATCVLGAGQTSCMAEAPLERQASLLRTSQGFSFVISATPKAPEYTVVQMAGLRVGIRLSEAAASVPVASATHRPYDPEPYPSPELRILAAFKVWGAIHEFFAYKDLMDEDWDDVFAQSLAKFIEARDATDYNLALAELMTHLADTNSAPHSKTLDSYFGEVPVGLHMRLLDKYPIVTEVLDQAAIAAGVRPGDVVKRVGSESITDRFRRLVQYVPASTPQRSGYDTIRRIANGADGSETELAIENAKGETHVVKLTRRRDFPHGPRSPSLPDGVGYLNLNDLSASEAEEAFAKLQNSKAIIFDLRGPMAPAAALLARHLTLQGSAAAAIVTTPLGLRPDMPTASSAVETSSTFVVQTLPTPAPPVYKGKTIALIDERTIGEAEYAGLLMEAANKTEFVGEPTAGAESAVAEMALPGGVTVTYSTEDIRHGNTGKLQRLGLQPNVSAPTTAKGLREGRDEAMDAALAHLKVR